MIRSKRRWWRLPSLALAALVLVPSAGAATIRVVGIDAGSYPQVQVTVVSPPGSARPRLSENGAAVTGLEAVNLGRSKSVAILVDRSQSMRGGALADAVAAARSFIAGKGAGDRVQVITFGHEAAALTRFSSSTADADAALRGLKVDRTAGTALWDAVALAARRLGAESEPGRVIIVLTDGDDVSSSATLANAVAAVHGARASVYPVGIAGKSFDAGPLRDLAARTGGVYHQASSSSQLAGIYAGIGRTLARTWQLRYATAARPGEVLSLSAEVPGIGRATRSLTLAGLELEAAPTPASGLLPRSAWTSPFAPAVLSGIVGLLILLACAFVFAARAGLWVRTRLEPHLGLVRRTTKARQKRGRRQVLQRLIALTEQVFANVKQFRALKRLLEQADMPLRGAELLYICVGSGILVGIVAAAAFSALVVTLLFMAVGAAIPVLYVKFKAGGRIKAFDNQLPDLLITIAASLKAGHSFRHAVQAVVDEGAEPASKEFTRVLSETQLGRSMDQALAEMSERVGSKNLSFVITAVTIQRQVGGSLASLFDMIADTVRQRQQFARRIKGLTAMGRMSAYVLIGLPFFMAIAISVVNPGYMTPLYSTSAGHKLIGVGLVMMAFGTAFLRRIVAFKG